MKPAEDPKPLLGALCAETLTSGARAPEKPADDPTGPADHAKDAAELSMRRAGS